MNTCIRVGARDLCGEVEWIIYVLFAEHLGINYCLEATEEEGFHIRRGNRSIELPNIFFPMVKQTWLEEETLPPACRGTFNTEVLGFSVNTLSQHLPIIYGQEGNSARITDHNIYLPIDIFGSSFFMLSRYEEAILDKRDAHGRFPAVASMAYRHGFLNRPLIDEYVEILWGCMNKLWPDLERRKQKYRTIVTCDVDHPYHPSAKSLSRLARRTASEMLHKRTFSDAIKPAFNYVANRFGNWQYDPYYHTVDWMMDVNERAGNKAAFYFIPEITTPSLDGTSAITDPAVRAMIRRISSRGHEIGIHPGYHTFQSGDRIAAGKKKLELVLEQEHLSQHIMGGRQHYLRWSTYTPANWDAAGLVYDSTLSYADHAGFRCGTCREYSMFDLHERKRLSVKQRSLICMEVSVIDAMRLGLTDAAIDTMCALKNAVRQLNGDFTLLWHNSSLGSHRAMEMYRHIIN